LAGVLNALKCWNIDKTGQMVQVRMLQEGK